MPTRTAPLLLVLTLILLTGCAQPPTAELQAAKAALAAAKDAGAAEYLPSLVEGAEASLDAAREAIEARQYEAARGFLTEATSQAQQAASGLEEAKSAVRQQLASRIESLRTRFPTVEADLASIEACPRSKRKSLDLDTALVIDLLEQVSNDLEAVQSTFDAGDYLAGLKNIDDADGELTNIEEQVTEAKAASGC